MGFSSSAYLLYGVVLGGADEGWNFIEDFDDVDDFEDNLYMTVSHLDGVSLSYSGHYDYSTCVLSAESLVAYGYGMVEIDPDKVTATQEMRDALSSAIESLASKGLTLDEEYRTPKWLLTSTYG